jgi:hypothetical protein
MAKEGHICVCCMGFLGEGAERIMLNVSDSSGARQI